MSIEAMKQARDAMLNFESVIVNRTSVHKLNGEDVFGSEIIALSQAIEEEERDNRFPAKLSSPNLEQILNAAGFYRKKKWIGLTDEEITELFCDYDGSQFPVFVRAIEAKLREKNT